MFPIPAWFNQGIHVAQRRPIMAWLAFLSVVLIAVPAFGNDYFTAVAVSVGTFAVLGLGLNVVVGYAGLLDLGYGAFFAIGAYTTAVLTTYFNVNFWLTLPVAMLMAMLAGVILGYSTLRLRGDYLAIVTLAFSEIVRIIATNSDYLGGPDGIWSIPSPAIGSYELTSQTDFYVVIVLMFAAAVAVTENVARSRLGLAWLAIREDEFAAESVGVPTLRLKLMAYMLGALWGGLAGGFFAARIGIINPQSFTLAVSLNVFIIVVVGGLGSVGGVLVGAFLVMGFPEFLRTFQDYRMLIYAIAIVAVMLVRPQGLWPHRRRRLLLPKAIRPEERESEASTSLRRSAGAGVVALEVSSLRRRFGGVQAVAVDELHVQAGEILSIIGPNGAGKTTLFNCVTGVQRPNQGSVMFQGSRVDGRRPHVGVRLGMARTFQHTRLFPNLTAYENVLVGMYARQRSRVWDSLFNTRRHRSELRESLVEAGEMLTFVGLSDVEGRLAKELPYADQRRLELARALASHPTLVLLDEPAAGMNPTEKSEFARTVRRIRQLGVTVVLIDHDMPLVMAVSDRIVVLDQGIVIAEGSPSEIQTNHRVIDAYLGRVEPEPAAAVAQMAAG